jgi:peptidoglycan biosynthesis protein MviN/MurJ (putative lipid II flippase)
VNENYREYFKLNRNLFIAFAVDILVSSIIAQLLVEQQHYLNATLTLLVDHATFLSVLGFLLYYDRRKYYKLDSGQTDWLLLKKDLLKIIASLGIAEIVYSIVRWVFQYYFLTIDYEPYIASLIGQLIAIAVYMVFLNFLVKISKWHGFSKKSS